MVLSILGELRALGQQATVVGLGIGDCRSFKAGCLNPSDGRVVSERRFVVSSGIISHFWDSILPGRILV